MSQQEPSSGSNGGPISWRDTYHLVEKVEERLTESLDQWGGRILGVQSDHEIRIRSLETARNERTGERRGEARVMGIGRSALALAVSILSGVVAAGTFVASVVSGSLSK